MNAVTPPFWTVIGPAVQRPFGKPSVTVVELPPVQLPYVSWSVLTVTEMIWGSVLTVAVTEAAPTVPARE